MEDVFSGYGRTFNRIDRSPFRIFWNIVEGWIKTDKRLRITRVARCVLCGMYTTIYDTRLKCYKWYSNPRNIDEKVCFSCWSKATNSGRRRTVKHLESMRPTMFKKGQLPWNTGRRFEAVSGNNHHLYNPQKPLKTRIIDYFHTIHISKQVFERDNYTCQACGDRGGKLHAHHIVKSFDLLFGASGVKTLEEAQDYSEFWDIVYLTTLCVTCHKNTDDYGCKSMGYKSVKYLSCLQYN